MWFALRGLFAQKSTQISLTIEFCEQTKRAPCDTKKSSEAALVEVKALKTDQVKAIQQLYLQGWVLQRKIRLIKVVTTSSERRFHYLHTGSRGPVASMQHFAYLASPRGIDHAVEVMLTFEDCIALRYLGMVTVDSDLPYIIDKSRSSAFDDSAAAIYKQDFKVNVTIAGTLLRRSLWQTEGLPGQRWVSALLQ